MPGADIAVIGAGIAGASLAAELAPHASVLLIEAEDRPGYHATGRSAAFWSETYGGPMVQPLTTASGDFLTSHGFLKPRGALHLADAAGRDRLDTMWRESAGVVPLQRADHMELRRLVPGLRPGWSSGIIEAGCADIDVAALHAFYLRSAGREGARLVTDARLLEAERADGAWVLKTTAGEHRADIVVDAAGAWADQVAERCGVPGLGIRPFRRTLAQLRIDPPVPPDLPLVIDALGCFYFKPGAGGRLWLSPHDETACVAGDCAPEEYDVALAIDRLHRVVDWRVEHVEHSWAGLRSFAPDRLPVFGFAAGRRDFFWYAGQGGFGIQTAPAAARLAVSLLLAAVPHDSVAAIDPSPYLADRFAN